PCWKALGSGQSIIQAVDDPQAPEWIKALRNQVEEIGIFPFGTEDLRGAGLIGVRERVISNGLDRHTSMPLPILGNWYFCYAINFCAIPLPPCPTASSSWTSWRTPETKHCGTSGFWGSDSGFGR
ncbi:diguanylate cyclase, putative, partial [Acidithiobacillus sp. GGI-221]